MRHESGTPAAPAEDGLAQALEDYLEAAEAGTAPPREQFLARHPELAEQLDGCLAALRFIGRAARGPLSAASGGEVLPLAGPEGEPVSGVLGDFRIVREVGRGGMGIVYEAEQISLGRRVALKVLPFAATMDPRQLQRFHNEARAAASLDHPHIVHVHAVGCERAVHFYAMQFIEGQTLASMIAELRQAGGRPVPTEEQPTTPHVTGAPAADTAPQAAASTERTRLDRAHYRRVAEWGVQAAEALDHAHQLGIVHRDVKPANLLVDGRGSLWVTDFGLAHVQSDSRLTMTGDLVGTLRYMSPEQALAKRVVIDHRTDVYSLGATLYELLTLGPAFRGNDRQELLRQIAFEEPVRPRRVNKAIPAELETIILKALEKNPQDRYATAKALADDLGRFLNDEPIRARPAGAVRRLRKWGRRHQAAVAAAVVVLALGLVLLGGAAGWLMQRRTAAEKEALRALAEAESYVQQARWPEAQAAARRAEGLLTGGGGRAELRQRVSALLDDLAMIERLEAIRLRQSQEKADGGGFDTAGADAAYARAFRDYGMDVEALGPAAGECIRARAVTTELATALDNWARARRRARGTAEGSWKHLLAIARAADSDPLRTQVRLALERGTEDKAQLEALINAVTGADLPATTLVLVAGSLQEARSATDVILGERAVAILREAQRRYPGDFWVNHDLAKSLYDGKPPQLDEAIRFYTAALALRPQSSGVHNNLGSAFNKQGRLDEAVAAYRKAIELAPDQAQVFHYNLGITLRAKGDVDGAIAEYREALRLKNDYPEAHTNLGNLLLRDKGDVDGAISEYREAIGTKQDFSEAYLAYKQLGFALANQGRRDEAIAAKREALRLKSDDAETHYNLGNDLKALGRLDEALAEFREAIRLQQDFPEAHCNLGDALRARGDFAASLEAYRRGHELGSKKPGWRYPSAQWVKEAERFAELDPNLPAVLGGREQPADAAERADYGRLCQIKRLHAAATRLYRDAFAARADLVASPANVLRYNAACAAALAGCGGGEDAAKLTDAERAGLRKQALDWLRADIEAWRGLLDKDPDKVRPAAAEKMRHWLRDADFAGVRGPDALAKLPEAERQDWQKLWTDVQRLLDRAAAKPPQPRGG
jgi:serine/threonine protein kinase/Flp pilus assembly protein TadD